MSHFRLNFSSVYVGFCSLKIIELRLYRDISDLLSQTIEHSLSQAELIEPFSSASDDEIIALTQLQMPANQDGRLSLLLDKQQAGTLSESDHAELSALMELYQDGLLRKAQGLRESVQRGLIEPLEA